MSALYTAVKYCGRIELALEQDDVQALRVAFRELSDLAASEPYVTSCKATLTD